MAKVKGNTKSLFSAIMARSTAPKQMLDLIWSSLLKHNNLF